jgi:hypothetical protein
MTSPPAMAIVAASAPMPMPAFRRAREAANAASRSRPLARLETTAACAGGNSWLPTPSSKAPTPGNEHHQRHSQCPANSAVATTVCRAPASSQRPATGSVTRPATNPGDKARPAAESDMPSTRTAYRRTNGRSRPSPTESTTRALAYRRPPAARHRTDALGRSDGFDPTEVALTGTALDP